MSCPLSSIKTLSSLFSASSRAENIPAGPAPTIITSYFNGIIPWNPNLDAATKIYF
jgi:hypothetical protein